ncbi:MAG: sugar phosphate isomerase/epimerase [Planctomycetota bacterium]
MPSPALDFGVQSWCFRHYNDNPTVAEKAKEIGLDAIELCEFHADFSDAAAFKDVIKIYRDADVKILSLGVQTFEGADGERSWFECAAAAGAKHISAHFKVDTFHTAVPKTAKLAEEFGIRVGIHCHGGYMFGGSQDVIDHLIKLGDGRIGLCIDTAWCMQTGPGPGNPVEWAQKYAGSIFGVHYKDFVFDKNAQWNDVVVGTGTLDLPAFVKALDDGGFDGMAVIEYEADVDNPVPALTKCVQEMRSLTA